MRYSIFNVARQALRGHQDWTPAWRDLTPRQSYDVIIIGGGAAGFFGGALVYGIDHYAW